MSQIRKAIIPPEHLPYLQQLGENIRLACKRRQLNQTVIAESTGLSRNTIRKIEQGDSTVSIGHYMMVLSVLGLAQDIVKVASIDEIGRQLQDAKLARAKTRRHHQAHDDKHTNINTPRKDNMNNDDPNESFLFAVNLAAQPNYLGNPEVVNAVLKPLFTCCLQAHGKTGQYQNKLEHNHRITQIMCEDGHGYTRMPGWHTENGLGASLVKNFALNADYCAGENLSFIVSEAIAALTMAIDTIIKQLVEALPEDMGEGVNLDPNGRLTELYQFAMTTFVGTDSVYFPDKTVKDFTIAPKPNSTFQELLSQLNALDAAQRQAPFRFSMIDVQIGTLLQFKHNPQETCEVVSDNKVKYQGEMMSLSAAARIVLKAMGHKASSARGPDYWLLDGMTLTELRNMQQPKKN